MEKQLLCLKISLDFFEEFDLFNSGINTLGQKKNSGINVFLEGDEIQGVLFFFSDLILI